MHTHVYRSSSSNSEISAISAPTTQHHNYNPWTENSPWHQSEREREIEREREREKERERKRERTMEMRKTEEEEILRNLRKYHR